MTRTRDTYQKFLAKLMNSNPVAYWPVLVAVVGGVKPALMLSQLLYWNGDKTVQGRHGWVWKTIEDMRKETGLTKAEQQTARMDLVNLGVISAELKGIPRRWFYKVELDQLKVLLSDAESTNSGFVDNSPLDNIPAQHRDVNVPIDGLESPPNASDVSDSYSYTTTDNTSEKIYQADNMRSQCCAPLPPSDKLSDETLSEGGDASIRVNHKRRHPAIQAIKDVTGFYPPKALDERIIKLLTDQPDMERLSYSFQCWVAQGYNPKDYAGWLFDWFSTNMYYVPNAKKLCNPQEGVADE